MNSEPSIRIVLDDGTDTWVTMVPIRGWSVFAVLEAVETARMSFIGSVAKDGDAVERHLRECIARGLDKK